MNGISLAALLGAATWFGLKTLGEDDDSDVAPADSGPSSEPVPEADTREFEILWPLGPMFQ